MAGITGSTTYGPGGGVTTKVDTSYGKTAYDPLEAYLIQRLEAKQRPAAPVGIGGGTRNPSYTGLNMTRGGGGEHAASGLDMANEENAIAKAQAASRPAPMSITTPWGSAGFATMDPDKMNAYQRQLYLPQGSAMAPNMKGPGDSFDDFLRYSAISQAARG